MASMIPVKNFFRFPSRNDIAYHPKQTGFDFVSRGSKTLFVTIGDSWTWGADLTPTQDNKYRLNHVYGNVIAKHFDYDFLNLAVGGCSNSWIAEQFSQLVKVERMMQYDTIICVITLTEAAREFNTKWDSTIDYSKWTKQNINSPADYYRLLGCINSKSCKQIANALSVSLKIKLFVGVNYVDPIGTHDLQDILFKDTWIDLFSAQINNPVQGKCYVASHWVIDRFEQIFEINPNLNKADFLTWMVEIIDNANTRLNYISDSNYFKRIHHPVASGHKCWADYIIKSLE